MFLFGIGIHGKAPPGVHPEVSWWISPKIAKLPWFPKPTSDQMPFSFHKSHVVQLKSHEDRHKKRKTHKKMGTPVP